LEIITCGAQTCSKMNIHVHKDNKFFVYEDKSDNWQRYLYTIEDTFMNRNIDLK